MIRIREGTIEMFIAYAIMEVGIWACLTIAAIHFENPHLYWFAVLGSIILPGFKQTSSKDNRKKEDDSDKAFILNISKNEGNGHK